MAMIPYRQLPKAADPQMTVAGVPIEEFYCGDPRCDCVTGHLWANGVGLSVDVGTGRVDVLDISRAPEREQVARVVAQQIKEGDTLERLRQHYRAVQEFGWDYHFMFIDWTKIKQGDFVTWHEVFLRDKVPLLPIFDKQQPGETPPADQQPTYYLGLSDSYCVDAKCDCKRVMWSVTVALPGDAEAGRLRKLGLVSFDFRKKEPGVVQTSSGMDANQLLITVLGLLQRYPGLIAEYQARYAKIREILIPIIAHQRRQKEAMQKDPMKDVGRNDPCPCGSGKKYKRCHGQGKAA